MLGHRFGPRMVFEEQGGGTTYHDGCKIYVDLVVGDLGGAAADHSQIVDLFRAFARHKQGEANFGYAEIATDFRLRDALCKLEVGKKFYSTLLDKMPLLSVSNDILGNPKNTENVEIFPLKELNDNPLVFLNKLYSASRGDSGGAGNYVLDKIDYLNKIISLKPGAFGVSLNVNAVIQTWIEKKRADRTSKQPKKP